jgi:hypothetical protein
MVLLDNAAEAPRPGTNQGEQWKTGGIRAVGRAAVV